MILHNSGLDDRMIRSDPGNFVTKALMEQLNNYLARIFNISEADLASTLCCGLVTPF